MNLKKKLKKTHRIRQWEIRAEIRYGDGTFRNESGVLKEAQGHFQVRSSRGWGEELAVCDGGSGYKDNGGKGSP